MALVEVKEDSSKPLLFQGGDEVHVFESVTLGSSTNPYALSDVDINAAPTKVTIDGTVIGRFGVRCSFGDSGDVVAIGTRGQIQASEIGAQVQGGTVENRGTIKASGGVFTWGTLKLTNTGTIKCLSGEVQIGVYGRGKLDVTNSGVIEGTKCGIQGSDVGDIVLNNGSIKSDGAAVTLGKGNDSYDGRAGTVSKLNATALGVIALGTGNDTAYGGAGQEQLLGEAGEDLIEGGGGNDQIDGGTETDTAVLSGKRSDYIVEQNVDGSFIVKDRRAGHDGDDTVKDVEFFKFNDRTIKAADLVSSGNPDGTGGNPDGTGGSPGTPGTSGEAGLTLIGTKSKNVLTGGAGNDKIYGKSGNDVLTGLGGRDVFVFDTKLGTAKTDRKVNFDTIRDFKVGEDKIWLENKIFKKLGKAGSETSPAALKKSFFALGHSKDKNDYIVYKKGVVSYDPDGSGERYKPVEIIKIANKAKLTAADFMIV